MPEETDIETHDLQEAIDELHQERQEREIAEREGKWTRYVGLATAIFAVFAALGALESGSLVNEAMIEQIKSSDTWNEYQADKMKVHMYELEENRLVDTGVGDPKPPEDSTSKTPSKRAGERLQQYRKLSAVEDGKTKRLSANALKLEKRSEELMHQHHRFAYSVTAIQVAIALGAVAALTKMKWVWFSSLVFGAIGLVYFSQGFF